MSTISNLRTNMTPKARLMIGVTIVFVVGIIAFSLFRVSFNHAKEAVGSVKLETAPTDREIHKDKASDKVIFGDNTEVAKTYQQDNQQRAEEATKGKVSHVDTLRVNVGDVGAGPKIEPKPEVIPPLNLQKLVQDRNAQAEVATAKVQSQQARSASNIQENPWKAFLDEEKKGATEFETSFAAKVDDIKSKSRTTTGKSSYDTTPQLAVASNTNTAEYGTSTSGYSKYLNQGKFSTTSTVDGAVNQKTAPRNTQASSSAGFGEADAPSSASDYPSERIAKSSVTKDVPMGSINVGQTFYSVLQIGVDTDEISPVRSMIVQKGLLEGAVLVGEPVRTGEKAKIMFTNMSWKGKNFSINAIALDPETSRSGLADGVDNHTFERYSKLAIASFVDGYSNALQSTQTITNTNGSSSTQTSALPNPVDQMKMGVGKIGQKFSPIFEKEFDRQPTVTVEPNKSIIVMFMASVDLTNGK